MSGARVVITAGGSGIGAEMARHFIARGDRVAVCDVDADAVAAIEAETGALAMVADVTDEAQMQAFLDAADAELGGVDALCANAGIAGPAGPIEDLPLAGWRDCISANLDGAFLTTRWAARKMRAQGSGCILLTTSTAGLFGYPNRSPYAVSKWGVIGLMKTLAMELGPAGVRVNAIAPAAVEGPRMDRVIKAEAAARNITEAEVREYYVKGVSMRSWVTAADVAETALWLTSAQASRISGQVIAVDGHTETLAP